MNASLKALLRYPYYKLERICPSLFYFLFYYRTLRLVALPRAKRDALFASVLGKARGKKCLQFGVKEAAAAKFGPNWTSVDKFDTRPFIDFNYDIMDLPFEEESFEVIVCLSILEHIQYPLKAISEMQRVLCPGGEIWVQLPFCFPYHGAPHDYWRVTPDGLRTWMQDFEEIACGMYAFTRTPLVSSTFFYGRKKD